MTPCARGRSDWLFLPGSERAGCQWFNRVPLDSGPDRGFTAVLELRVRSDSAGQVDLRPEDVHRLECYTLIARIKDRGLGEAVQSLRDMVEFYADEPPPALPPAPTPSYPTHLSGSYVATIPPISEG